MLGRQPVLVPQISHKTDLGLNLSFHSKRLETNRMSHYMALPVIYLYVPVYVCSNACDSHLRGMWVMWPVTSFPIEDVVWYNLARPVMELHLTVASGAFFHIMI